jgi:hypothetical protein
MRQISLNRKFSYLRVYSSLPRGLTLVKLASKPVYKD